MSTNTFVTQGVRVAVEGCGHGTLNAIYAAIDASCAARGWDGVDLLIIGGDFEALRNAADMNVMSVPAKYREMGDFHEYYSGARRAPYLTLFVAGNHEASSYLWELYYGGWVAPNIYYLGAANVLRLGPLRIAGMSGIWKGHDYRKLHHERLPFNGDDIKSFYHVREFDVRKLLLLREQADIGISHDWPRAIERYGDENKLFRMKPDFRDESRAGTLGNVAAEYVMDRLRPPYWFSAHMHCKFSAVKKYDAPGAPAAEAETSGSTTAAQEAEVSSAVEQQTSNPDEIDLDMDDDGDAGPSTTSETPSKPAAKSTVEGVSADVLAELPDSFARPQTPEKSIPGQPVPPTITNTEVRFLALDKCLPGRKFLQLCEIEPFNASESATHPPSDSVPRYQLSYDPEWLAITRVFSKYLAMGDRTAQAPPNLGEAVYAPLIDAELKWVDDNVVQKGKLAVPDNFTVTAPEYNPQEHVQTNEQPDEYTNPQTAEFCSLVGVENHWEASETERAERKMRGPPPSAFRGGGGRGFGGRGGGRGGHNRGGRGSRGRGWQTRGR